MEGMDKEGSREDTSSVGKPKMPCTHGSKQRFPGGWGVGHNGGWAQPPLGFGCAITPSSREPWSRGGMLQGGASHSVGPVCAAE